MKRFLLLSALCSLLSAPAFAQTKNVTKTISTNGLVENLVVPSGKTLTINSGGSIVNNGTATGFSSSLAIGTSAITGGSNGDVLYNNNGTLGGIATSTGGNLLTDAGKIVTFSNFGALRSTQLELYGAGGAGTFPSVFFSSLGIQFAASGANSTSLFAAPMTGTITLNLPPRNGTLICTGDTGTVTDTMLAGSIAISKLAITGTPDGTKYLRDDGTWQTVTSGATTGANTFSGLQQFSGTDHAGLRLNNLTTTQRDAIATPAAGMVIWNTTAARIQAYNGSAWTAGMVRLDGDTMTGTLVLPAGTVSAPALTLGDSTTGIYRTGTNEVAIGTAGTQRMRFGSTGGIFLDGDSALTLFRRTDVDLLYLNTADAGNGVAVGGGQLVFGGGAGVFWTNDLPASSKNTGFTWDGVGLLGMRAAPSTQSSTQPQALQIYNTYTGSGTNFERVLIGWVSNVFQIRPASGGTGTARNAQYYTTTTVFWSSGSGTPEGAVTAPVGSIYTRTDGGASTTLYIKESGTGNTGWVAK